MIKLNNGFSIISDASQYTLKQTKQGVKEDTKEIYTHETTEGYYTSLEQALQAYVRKTMMCKVSKQDLTLNDVLNELKQLRKEITEWNV